MIMSFKIDLSLRWDENKKICVRYNLVALMGKLFLRAVILCANLLLLGVLRYGER